MADSMQQLEEEDDCLTPRQSTAVTLRYPSIAVDGTPDSWLSSSLLVPMASSQDEDSVRSYDDTMSSLGDSTYEFIDDTSISATDDEGQSRLTDSVSVVGGTQEEPETHDLERTLSAEDVRHWSSNDLARDNVRSFTSSSTSGPEEPAVGSSPQPSRAQRIRLPSSSDCRGIRFDETRHGEGFYQLESPSLAQNLAITVRQHMLPEKFSVERAYKVLYVGNPAAQEQIITKIGAALAANANVEAAGPSRYSVIPMPSSDDPTCSSDPVLLDWSGHGMIVYRCVDASFRRTANGHDTIGLSLEGDTHVQSLWDGAKFSILGSWEAPDVAIFYLSDNDDVSARQTRRLARSFMARNSIPSIVICEKPSWIRPSETIAIDHHTPHVCLQTKTDIATSSRIIKRLPIDLTTFSHLDAVQLNRNLSYLNTAYRACRTNNKQATKPDNGRSKTYRSIYAQWGLDESLGFVMTMLPNLRRTLSAAGVFVVLSLLLTQLVTFPSRSTNSGLNHGSTGSCTLASSSQATAMAALQSNPTAEQSLTLSEVAKARVKSSQNVPVAKPHTDLATLFRESSPMTTNKSEKFQAQILGNAHIILRPPHWFTRLRKIPKLNFNVTRGDRLLKHEVSVLFDGVYALELPKDDAHGIVNISVWRDSRPKILETLQADFGIPWLRAAGWKKAASALSSSLRQDLDLVQTSISAIYVDSSAELHSLMRKTLAKAQDLKNETRAIGKASVSQLAKVQDHILALSKEVASNPLPALKQKQIAAANEISLRTAGFRRNVSSYLAEKAHIARVYARSELIAYRIHLRDTQKRTIKMWWSLVGLPQQQSVTVKANRKSRAYHGGRRKKQTVNE